LKIRVKFFAALREDLDKREFVQELPQGATLGTLVEQFSVQYPVVGAHLPSLHFAVNHKYAPLEAVLQEGDEVAFLPPVGGG
jgi:molybdopterin converting factor subunit 1